MNNNKRGNNKVNNKNKQLLEPQDASPCRRTCRECVWQSVDINKGSDTPTHRERERVMWKGGAGKRTGIR